MNNFCAINAKSLIVGLSLLALSGATTSAFAQNLTRPASDLRAQEATVDVTPSQLRAQRLGEGRSVYDGDRSLPFFGSILEGAQ